MMSDFNQNVSCVYYSATDIIPHRTHSMVSVKAEPYIPSTRIELKKSLRNSKLNRARS